MKKELDSKQVTFKARNSKVEQLIRDECVRDITKGGRGGRNKAINSLILKSGKIK